MGSLFSTPKPPAIPAPEPMPDPNDELVKQRSRQAAAKKIQAGGRESTTQFSAAADKPYGA